MRLWRAITDNAILVRELRRRMRGRILVFSIILYVSVLCGVAYVIVFSMTKGILAQSALPTQQLVMRLSSIGKALFWATMGIQAFLVVIIAPIMTASIAPMEREKKTFEFIQVTTITPASFIFGCLMSALLYAVLVTTISLPVVSLAFLYGGVSPGDVLRVFGLMLLLSVTFSSIGLFVSATRERLRAAIGGIGGLIFLLYFLSAFLVPHIVGGLHGGMGIGRWLSSAVAPTFYGFRVPLWAFVLGVCTLLTTGALLVATRKLYNARNRALSFKQAFVALLLIAFIILGFVWRDFNNANFAIYLFSTALVVLATIINCSIGDRRIGDEQWRLKKKYRSLRALDEGTWFPITLIALWIVSFVVWLIIAVSWSHELISALPVILASFVVVFLFIIAIARLISLYVADRRSAARLFIAFLIILLGLIPTAGATLLAIPSKMPKWPLIFSKRLSPPFLATDYMGAMLTPGRLPQPDIFGLPAGSTSILLYVTAAILVVTLNKRLRQKKLTLPPYYYEL